MSAAAPRSVLVALTFVASIAGIHCISLVGDFAVDDSSSGSEAGVDATADSSVQSDAARPDTGRDGSPSSDGGPTGDASCGSPCTPSVCHTGVLACDTDALVCAPTGTALDGTTCGEGSVCNKGVCQPCAAGTDCTPAGECKKKTIVCSTGAPVCTDDGNVKDGESCGANLYCTNGACQPCTNGSACTPPNAACNKGSVVCSGGTASCTDTGTAAGDGTTCGTNQVCKTGACVSCSASPTGRSTCSP